MINYDTIVILDREIQEKVEFYRPFLEKSEFGTFFEDVLFVSENPADGTTSAGLNGVRNCLFLYGILDKEGYARHYGEIEAKRKDNPNMDYYMLFCQNRYYTCAPSAPAAGSIKKTFSIGILEDTDINSDNKDDSMYEDMRAIKLLSMAMAIYTCNKGASKLSFDNYYVTAGVELNLDNLYFAIMHKISEYADKLAKTRHQIEVNESKIEELNKKEPKICEGVFPDDKLEDFSLALGDFSDYDDMEKLRCKMEFEYDRARKAVHENISTKIDIARKAEAIAEKSATDDEDDFQGYMRTRNADVNDVVPTPDDILKVIETDGSFDSHKIKSLLPLAQDLGKADSGSGVKVFLSSLSIAFLFILCFGVIYLIRYLKSGLNGATLVDFVSTIAIPAVFVLLTGIAVLIAYLVIKHSHKNIFKDVYASLMGFFKKISTLCSEVRQYINKYLTVYYNYHVKYAKISKLEESITFLEKETQKIRKHASALNEVAETICKLGDSDFVRPDVSFAKDRSEYPSSAVAFALKIKQNSNTEVHRKNNSVKTPSPWLKKISYETGNINGGVQ